MAELSVKDRVHVKGLMNVFDVRDGKIDVTSIKEAVRAIVDDNTWMFIEADVNDEKQDKDYKAGDTYLWSYGTLLKASTSYHIKDVEPDSTTIQLGGISSGTTASSLEGKTYDELFEMLLYPTYIPKLTTANASFSLSTNSTTLYPYDQIPTGLNYVTGGRSITTGATTGQPTETKTNPTINNADSGMFINESTLKFLNGIYTWQYQVIHANGTTLVTDNKGNNCKYVSDSSTTILRSTCEAATGSTLANYTKYTTKKPDSDDEYVLVGYTGNLVQKSINVVTPSFLKKNSTTAETSIFLTTSYNADSFGWNPSQNNAFYIDIPKDYVTFTDNNPSNITIDKWNPMANGGQWETKNFNDNFNVEEHIRTINGIYKVQYVRISYKGNGEGDGKCRINISGNTWGNACSYTLE